MPFHFEKEILRVNMQSSRKTSRWKQTQFTMPACLPACLQCFLNMVTVSCNLLRTVPAYACFPCVIIYHALFGSQKCPGLDDKFSYLSMSKRTALCLVPVKGWVRFGPHITLPTPQFVKPRTRHQKISYPIRFLSFCRNGKPKNLKTVSEVYSFYYMTDCSHESCIQVRIMREQSLNELQQPDSCRTK